MSDHRSNPDEPGMVPGEIICAAGDVQINATSEVARMTVVNGGDRPVQVGSHYHFAQANDALDFDRARAHGRRLNVPAGTAVRFEPGIEMEVELVPIGGARVVAGLSLNPPGELDSRWRR